jgi:predicted Ser/Thr protein kinase
MNHVPLASIAETSILPLLSYPSSDIRHALPRLEELRRLEVSELCAGGPSSAGGHPVLGLGYCGLVLLGRRQGEQVAIKLRRSDSTQPDLQQESEHLRHANRTGVGPRLYAASDNVLIMEYLPGAALGTWLATGALKAERARAREIIGSLLRSAFALDMAGLDHGALRCVAEHAIIESDRTTLIDFSHASRRRRAANVTTLVQGLFWGTRLAEDLGRFLPLPHRGTLIPLLQQYKQKPSADTFEVLRQTLSV